jgi:hypothetical protein
VGVARGVGKLELVVPALDHAGGHEWPVDVRHLAVVGGRHRPEYGVTGVKGWRTGVKVNADTYRRPWLF